MTQANVNRTGHTVVGIFEDVSRAERAINDLKVAGFTPDSISVVTKDRSEQSTLTDTIGDDGEHNKAGEGVLAGSLGGGTLGAVIGWLLAGGTALIPGVGPVVAAGIFGATAAGALIGGSLGGVAGGLAGSGVPEDEASEYQERVKGGSTLLTVQAANGNLLEAAMDVFERNQADSTRYYDMNQPGPGRTYDRAQLSEAINGRELDDTDSNRTESGDKIVDNNTIKTGSPNATVQPGRDPSTDNQSIYAKGKSEIATPEEFDRVRTDESADRVRRDLEESDRGSHTAGGTNSGERKTMEDISTLPDRGTGTSTRGGTFLEPSEGAMPGGEPPITRNPYPGTGSDNTPRSI